MIECVAVLGRMIIDRPFHESLFNLTDHNKKYQDLIDLNTFLNDTHQLRLCRWEMMRVNILSRQEILYIKDAAGNTVEIRTQHFAAAKDDGIVNRLQDAWLKLGSKLAIDFKNRDHLEHCAALGLACIDHVFLANMAASAKTADTTPLRAFLTTKPPRFTVPADLTAMNQFLQNAAVVADLTAFHAERWVQPNNPCDLGYTFDSTRDYRFVSQTEIDLLLDQSAPVRNALSAFRDKFKDNFAPAL
jgi:hypothetical protein